MNFVLPKHFDNSTFLFKIDNNLLNYDNNSFIMSYIRLHPAEKAELEELAGEDLSMNEVVRILLDNFIESDEGYDDDDDDDGG